MAVPSDIDKEQPLDSYLRELVGFALRGSLAEAIEYAAERAAELEKELAAAKDIARTLIPDIEWYIDRRIAKAREEDANEQAEDADD